MAHIFDVEPNEIERFNQYDAVRLIRSLLWAEARRLQLSASAVTISDRVNVPDGGIDATIDGSTPGDFLRPPKTGLQIKTGNYCPWQRSSIETELLERGQLKPQIHKIFNEGGAYLLLCTGKSLTDRERDDSKDNIRDILTRFGFASAAFDVFSSTEISAAANKYPSISLAIKGLTTTPILTHDQWSRENDMQLPLVDSVAYSQKVSDFQQSLRTSRAPAHIRLIEPAGSGKTRFCFEATKAPDLSPTVLKCTATELLDQNLLPDVCRRSENARGILIVDECDNSQAAYAWSKIRGFSNSLTLVTVHTEGEAPLSGVEYFEQFELDADQITKIIESYAIPPHEAGRWAAIAGRSPRFAHLIGQNLREFPTDPLNPSTGEGMYDRIVCGRHDPNSVEGKRYKLVFAHLALFRRIGFTPEPLRHEAEAVLQLITKTDQSITKSVFQEIVEEFQRRKLLQGEHSLYITPEALHIWMWRYWWQHFNPQGMTRIEEIVADLPDGLRQGFFTMFRYADTSGAANETIRRLLADGGPFDKIDAFADRLGGNFFLALVEANPANALHCLERVIGRMTQSELKEQVSPRRTLVYSLERLAVWKEHFPRAAKLLLTLGAAENETWGNNATGVFAELFRISPNFPSDTEAPASDRIGVLRDALESESKEARLLGLRACEKAINTVHASRAVGPEYQGLRKAELWHPKTWEDFHDAMRGVWELVVTSLDRSLSNEWPEASGVLIRSSSNLARFGALTSLVVDTLRSLAEKGEDTRREIIKAVAQVLRHIGPHMEKGVKQRWEDLRSTVEGTGFAARLRRYVGLEIFDDEFDDQGNRTQKTEKEIASLSLDAMNNPELLRPELNWLVTGEAKRGYLFGYQLERRDPKHSLVDELIRAVVDGGDKSNAFLLSGYFHGIHERDLERWEQLLDQLAADPMLKKHVPEITARNGLTPRAARRVLTLAKQDSFVPHLFSLWRWGHQVRVLPEDLFEECVSLLYEKRDRGGLSPMIELMADYYCDEKHSEAMLPEKYLSIISDDLLFMELVENRNTMIQHDLERFLKRALKTNPQWGPAIARILIQRICDRKVGLTVLHSGLASLFVSLAEVAPDECWRIISDRLTNVHDYPAWRISELLSDKPDLLSVIPAAVILAWIDENPSERASFVARFASQSLLGDDESISAYTMLSRYGDIDGVEAAIYINFSSGTFWGPASEHFATQKSLMQAHRKTATNKNVIRWLDGFVESLEQQSKNARIAEEREDY